MARAMVLNDNSHRHHHHNETALQHWVGYEKRGEYFSATIMIEMFTMMIINFVWDAMFTLLFVLQK